MEKEMLCLFLWRWLLLLVCLAPFFANSMASGTSNCTNVTVPYPFVIVDKSYKTPALAPGFEISCVRTGPMLSIGNSVFGILEISLEGYVRIVAAAVAQQCNNNPVFSLDGTIFTFSDTRNKFTAVGCDVVAMLLNDSIGPDVVQRQISPHHYSGGCVSFCPTNHSMMDGMCSGVGCCQAPVPRGLQKLNLEFTSISKQLVRPIKDNSIPPCGEAFIVEQNSYVFSTVDLNNSYWNNMNKRSPPYRQVVLEWSIHGGSCEKAKGSASYACKENANCYDSPNGIGYRCNCSQGFEGNPYQQGPDGCRDIDECSTKNTCTHKCINTEGSFYCMCPTGMTGDGKKEGNGCNGISVVEIAIVAGLALLVLLLSLGFWTRWLVEKRKVAKLRQRYFMQNGGLLLKQKTFSYRAPLQIFTSSELDKATNNFSDDRIVGRGGYGTVYKGILSNQTIVAIKKAQGIDQSQMEQFINELVILSQVNHRNVVRLLGCCLETQVPLLVYEFISNGALFHHLHNASIPMSWGDRLRIANETASALAYLHLATKVPIIHRDVKSSNILLDESFTSKVSDFGASRSLPYNQTHVTTLVQGTLGYLDPEYFHTILLTEKSDVYSFGVLLVELLTRKKPISNDETDMERNLAWHFCMLFHQNRLSEIVDSQVTEEVGMRHVKAAAQLALKCLRFRGEERPRMIEVAVELEALRRLMKQHLALRSEEEPLPQELRCHEELNAGGSSNLGLDDIDKNESMESNLLPSRDLSC